MALADDGIGAGIDGAYHIQVDKAVVEWRDQRIGHGVSEAGEIAVGSGRVHHDEIVGSLDRPDRLGETGELDRLILVEPRRSAARDAKMGRRLELDVGVPRPHAAILHAAGKASLARIEVDGCEPLAEIHQRDGAAQPTWRDLIAPFLGGVQIESSRAWRRLH